MCTLPLLSISYHAVHNHAEIMHICSAEDLLTFPQNCSFTDMIQQLCEQADTDRGFPMFSERCKHHNNWVNSVKDHNGTDPKWTVCSCHFLFSASCGSWFGYFLFCYVSILTTVFTFHHTLKRDLVGKIVVEDLMTIWKVDQRWMEMCCLCLLLHRYHPYQWQQQRQEDRKILHL